MQATSYEVQGPITSTRQTQATEAPNIVIYTLWNTAYQQKEIDYNDLEVLLKLFDNKTVSEVKPKVREIYNAHLAIADKQPLFVTALNLFAYMRDNRPAAKPSPIVSKDAFDFLAPSDKKEFAIQSLASFNALNEAYDKGLISRDEILQCLLYFKNKHGVPSVQELKPIENKHLAEFYSKNEALAQRYFANNPDGTKAFWDAPFTKLKTLL